MSDRTTLIITRSFGAPKEEVFRLWTDPALVSQWWGIAGSTIPRCDLDVRIGGKWRIEMRTATGKVYPNAGEYLEVAPPDRLVYSDVPDPGVSEWNGNPPGTSRHSVTFETAGGRTVVTLEILFATDEDRRRIIAFGMKDGIEQGLDRLAALLATRASPEPWNIATGGS